MINTVLFVHNVIPLKGSEKTKTNTKSSEPQKSPQVSSDRFEMNTSKSDKRLSGKVEYTEPTTILGIITLRKGFYTYYPRKNETIADIKRKFGIKDGVIKEMNNGIKDDNYCPVQNKIYEVYFR